MLAYLKHQLPILGSLAPKFPSFLSDGVTMTSGNYTGPTVIVGGGIIGLSTAYYLASDTWDKVSGKSSNNNIVVVEASSKICAGASGQNEGVAGDFGVKNEIMPLAKLSYDLHFQIAEEYKGKEKYGFSSLTIHALFSNGYEPSNHRLPFPVIEQESLSRLPRWINVSSDWQAGSIDNGNHSIRM